MRRPPKKEGSFQQDPKFDWLIEQISDWEPDWIHNPLYGTPLETIIKIIEELPHTPYRSLQTKTKKN